MRVCHNEESQKNVKLQNTNKKAKGSVVNKVNARKNTKKAIKKAQQIWQRKVVKCDRKSERKF